jgi:hypothetical protein
MARGRGTVAGDGSSRASASRAAPRRTSASGRRRASTRRPITVATSSRATSSAAALASVGLSLVHHLDAAAMVLTWHGLSVLVMAGLASLLGPRLMRRGFPAP